MLVCLLLAAGVALLGAVVPVVSIDAFVIAVAIHDPHVSRLGVAMAAAAGQVLGRLVYFLAARGDVPLPPALRRRLDEQVERWRSRPDRSGCGRWSRIRQGVRRLLVAGGRHPAWSAAVLAISSFAGLPPITVSTLWFGRSGMSTAVFVGVGLPTRAARFLVLAAVPALLTGWSL